jgi:integrase
VCLRTRQGNPVLNRQALQAREALLDKLASIRVPDGPLDQLLNYFGVDRVSEVTGRRLIWWTFVGTGLRVSELCSLRRDDLDATGRRLRIRGETSKRGEHGKDHWQPLPADLAAALAQYLLTHRYEPIFPSLRGNYRGRARKPRSLLETFYGDCKAAGIDTSDHSVDLHALRATYTTRMVENCPALDIATLAQLTRHTNPTVTLKHYLKARDSAAREAVNAMGLHDLTDAASERAETAAQA